MKILKTILLVLFAIIVIALVTAFFLKSDYAVERKIVIKKPISEVFDYVKYLKNQNKYSKWATADSSIETFFKGTDGTTGFISGWKSKIKDVGEGEQEITKIENNKRIDYELRFIKPMQSTEHAFMTTTALNDSTTKVVWGFYGKMDYPSNLMLLFMNFDDMIGGDFETGLKNLKVILENEKN